MLRRMVVSSSLTTSPRGQASTVHDVFVVGGLQHPLQVRLLFSRSSAAVFLRGGVTVNVARQSSFFQFQLTTTYRNVIRLKYILFLCACNSLTVLYSV